MKKPHQNAVSLEFCGCERTRYWCRWRESTIAPRCEITRVPRRCYAKRYAHLLRE